MKFYRAITEPIRVGLSRGERWGREDQGLIWCWELGRVFKDEGASNAIRAQAGELPMSDWKGGVKEKLKAETKQGSLQYLAQWQGMRGEDLSIDSELETTRVCSRFGQRVVYTAKLIDDE